MAKVTGIGGVFLKSTADDAALVAWYQKNLGIAYGESGCAILSWTDDKAEDKGLTVWTIAPKNSAWFAPSSANFMINYRVDNLAEMIAQLQQNGVDIFQGPEQHENGKFAWVIDPDGNKVELWEPKIWDEKNKS
jgi:predicted enzyme related to lactoylglutathione lyase